MRIKGFRGGLAGYIYLNLRRAYFCKGRLMNRSITRSEGNFTSRMANFFEFIKGLHYITGLSEQLIRDYITSPALLHFRLVSVKIC